MKKQTARGLAMLAILVTLAAITQAQMGEKMRANIPFNFMVNDQSLPAGQYEIAQVRFGMTKGVRIQSFDRRLNAIVLTNPTDESKYQADGKLVFHHQGNQYLLMQVQIAGTSETHIINSPGVEAQLKDVGAQAKQILTMPVRGR